MGGDRGLMISLLGVFAPLRENSASRGINRRVKKISRKDAKTQSKSPKQNNDAPKILRTGHCLRP